MSGKPPFPENLLYGIELYPERVDFNNRALLFCRMSRESYRASPFLDHRIVRAPGEGLTLAFRDVDSLGEIPGDSVAGIVQYTAYSLRGNRTRWDAVEPRR